MAAQPPRWPHRGPLRSGPPGWLRLGNAAAGDHCLRRVVIASLQLQFAKDGLEAE